jgi:prepilin-type N-terminal cleavage/methylation domain-containing protein
VIKNKKQNAFTLIELLIVISIIGLLASIVLVSLNSARTKARDVRRQADIRQLMTALELYYDTNNAYPSARDGLYPNSGWANSADASWATLQSQMSAFMSRPPIDPVNQTGGWAYTGVYNYSYYGGWDYGCSQQWYIIVYKLEANLNVSSPGQKACDGTYFNYGSGSDGIVTVGNKTK